jgi:hypothetical protein
MVKPKVNIVEKRWFKLLSSSFKLKWANTWNKMCSKKEASFIWVIWNYAMALNLWKVKVDGLINQGCLLWVNVNCNGSISTKITFPTSPYKIFLNDSNGHGCYLKIYYYSIL